MQVKGIAGLVVIGTADLDMDRIFGGNKTRVGCIQNYGLDCWCSDFSASF